VTTTGAHLAGVIVNTNIATVCRHSCEMCGQRGTDLKFGRVNRMLFSVTVSYA